MEKEIDDKLRTRCEVYSRVVGYFTATNTWNDGKRSEYNDRKEFVVENEND